ncbi:Adenylate and Guanylate cyclase catalytic domain containing protein [Trichomonas vaginalis G3]|uniref:Adenylate and Guanylate cyclase catalytic domain containing protein n=1 Tax=Trichomonas vaginalis (strain ATCC PRA-98 / G3) TaxID=412133 RepID=A2DDF2_TRIV3|nr:guanylate cyclase protein [Trichomonas vaginalis G3]EAY21631.1 Adenylate and Guanylate cyclase catalytic domain containing protein [Trichomonas vaginalis G3]KAI5489693.1 guanylate cyclase protein [Trichomonas vaginalis G3]|eukprot:XP_001582617.1 Adenylate and Guanylate cyclase catalytic domain containing protein [Trichomonas vaginalis G3]
MIITYICFGVCGFTLIWSIGMVFYIHKYYTIRKSFLVISVLFIDLICPLFIAPSAYVTSHGIACLSKGYNVAYPAEIVLGGISYLISIVTFCNFLALKSKTVVFTNLMFQLYDATTIGIWFILTTSLLIVTAIMQFFKPWFVLLAILSHMFISIYIAYRLIFIPFYTLWRNPTCFAFAIVTILLDINFIVVYGIKKLHYDYVLILFLVLSFVSYIFSKIFFKKRIQKISENLTYQDDIENLGEYFDSLDVCKNDLTVMMYCAVGVAELCDYFVDGSLIDFINENCRGDESILSIILQVVTYFPSDSHKLNLLYKKLVSKQKLSYLSRFLIFQIFKVKTRRLSSNSKDTIKTYNMLKSMNDECRLAIQSFWDKPTANSHLTTHIKARIMAVHDCFEYILLNNPNNLRITNEYVNFLLEVECDFSKAIEQAIKAEEILDGKNFNVDLSFRSLVYKFPKYLENGVLDIHGNKIMKDASRESNRSEGLERRNSEMLFMLHDVPTKDKTTNDTGHCDNGNGKNDLYIDAESEETVGKRILRDAKVRLALHHSIAQSKPYHSILITIFTVFAFIVNLFCLAGFTYNKNSLLIWRRDNYIDLQSMGRSIFYLQYSNFFTIVDWAKKVGRYNYSDSLLKNISIDANRFTPIVQSNLSTPQSIFYCANESRANLQKIIKAAAQLAASSSVLSSQYSAYEMVPELLKKDSYITECTDGSPNNSFNASLKDQIVFLVFEAYNFAGNYNENIYPANLFNDDDYCEVMTNMFPTADDSIEAYPSIFDYNIGFASGYNKYFIGIMYCITFAMGFLSIIPFLFILISYQKMANKTLKILLSLPTKIKEQAKEPLALDYVQNSEFGSGSKLQTNNSKIFHIVIYLLSVVLFLFFFVLMTKNTITLNNECTNLIYWYYYSMKHTVLASEVANNVVQFILLSSNSYNQNVTTTDFLKSRITSTVDALMAANDILVNGNDDVDTSVGWDSNLDAIQVNNQCELGRDPSSIHDMYACSSISSQLTMFKNMIDEIIKNPSDYNGSIDTEYTANIIHLLQVHLFPSINKFSNKIAELMVSNYDKKILRCSILLIFGALCLTLCFTMILIFRFFVIESYRMLLIFIKHLPPQEIMENKDILNFFRGYKESSAPEEMSISKSIVYGASECIIITNQSSNVQIVNPAVSENLGLTPDQMLGQPITNFLPPQDQAVIKQQIELMLQGQGSTVWQDHIEMIKDQAGKIPFAVTMIGMKDNDNDTEINSIVFILTNEEEEIKKRKDAEIAKAKSEKLLYQILPKDIVVRLNRGEKDISFTIPKATIFFVDIVKFSNYAAALSPSEIMSNLSLVFSTFDKIVVKYPTILKIKLIGDVYMAAAGIFSDPQMNPSKPAEESVNCCLDIQKVMEQINVKLSAGLEVRIGVNTGGPLIGGVLGTDKPTFDIIGDPINVASRLQSTDIPGKVQISQETKEMIAGSNFVIEERGEVYLKGKGNRTTYFVMHQSRSSASLEESFAINMFSGNLS